MFQNQDPYRQRDQRSMLTRSIEGAITIIALAAAVLGGMALFDFTDDPIQDLAVRIYGAGSFADLIVLLWLVCCYGICFFAARASLLALWLIFAGAGLRYGASLAF